MVSIHGTALVLLAATLALSAGAGAAQEPEPGVRPPQSPATANQSAATADQLPATGDRLPNASGYVASSRGQVYYWTGAGCDAWRRLSRANLRSFATAADARAAGYRPSATPGCAGPSHQLPATSDQLPATGSRRCTIERVSDGDTVVCSGERVRLLLIDAPESRQQDLGLRARLALEELIPVGTAVRLEFDVERRDRYRRLLAHIHGDDGTWVNHAMVRRGYALVLVYPPNVRHVEAMRAAATAAREEGAGLWAGDGFRCEPRTFRRGACR